MDFKVLIKYGINILSTIKKIFILGADGKSYGDCWIIKQEDI